jgi:hypothetical protein
MGKAPSGEVGSTGLMGDPNIRAQKEQWEEKQRNSRPETLRRGEERAGYFFMLYAFSWGEFAIAGTWSRLSTSYG